MNRQAWTARREQFAKHARARFDRHERQLQPAVQAAIDGYLTLCRPGVLAVTRQSLIAAAPLGDQPADAAARAFPAERVGQVIAVMDRFAGSQFGTLLDQHVMPVYARMLDEVLGTGLSDRRVGADLLAWRGQWLDARRQALVGVPDFITGVFRTALRGLAEQQGTDVGQAETLAQQLLDRGYPSWTGRAQLIARTETVAANNQGALQAWSTLAHASGQPATKTWLATSDDRTRPEHAELDGTTVDVHDDFDVGGYSMNGPGDDAGGPEQVCNCRCTLTYDFPEQPGDTAGQTVDQAVAVAPAAEPGAHAAAGSTFAGPRFTWALDDAGLAPSAAATAATGVAVMLGLGAGTEDAILTGCGIDPASVDPPGLHCTLAYLDTPAADYDAATKTAVLSALAALGDTANGSTSPGLMLYADAFATAHFNPDSDEREPCAVLLVQSEELARLHAAVGDALGKAGVSESDTFPIWIPHVAVAYNADPSIIPVDKLGDVLHQLEFNRLVVAWGDEQHTVAGDGAETVDPAGQTGGDNLTAAAEDNTMTAPTDTQPATPAPNTAPEATGGDTPAPAAEDLTPQGQTWEGPLAILDVASSDGRRIAATGGIIRPLPQPLSWQRESGYGHEDSTVVGRILTVDVRQATDPELAGATVLWGTGDYLDPMVNFDAEQAKAQVDAGLGFVSVDLAQMAVGWCDADGNPLDPGLANPDVEVQEVTLEWELGGATIVSFAAFAGARIRNVPMTDIETTEDVPMMPGGVAEFAADDPAPPSIAEDGASVTLPDGSIVKPGEPVGFPDGVGTLVSLDPAAGTAVVQPPDADDGTTPDPVSVPVTDLTPAAPVNASDSSTSLVASSEVRPYTKAFFEKRDLAGPTPFTVNPETGEAYGHIAEEGTCHTGKLAESGVCVTVPHSEADYSYFHLSPVLMDDGTYLDVGKITAGTGHAAPGGGFANAVAHYDNSGTTAALGRVYDDDYGVQFAGQIVHDLAGPKVEELMAHPISGDWRAQNGHLELCAALAVPVPGFPVRRRGPVVGLTPKGHQMSLVAAGVVMPRPGRVLDSIGLPSGATIERGDFVALVAAAADALAAGKRPKPETDAQALALRKARALCALGAV